MQNSDLLSIIELIAKNIVEGIQAYRAGQGVAEAPAAIAPKKRGPAAKSAKPAKRLSISKMMVKVIRSSATPMKKVEIIKAIKTRYGADVKIGSLNAALLIAVKKKKISHASYGRYARYDAAAAKKAAAPAVEEAAPANA